VEIRTTAKKPSRGGRRGPESEARRAKKVKLEEEAKIARGRLSHGKKEDKFVEGYETGTVCIKKKKG